MGKGQEYKFYDWIDAINDANKDATQFQGVLPNMTYGGMTKQALKQLTYRNVYNRLYNIVLKMFEWETPPTLNSRIIEKALIDRGQICLFKGKLGTLCLPCLPNNKYNVYGDPLTVNVFGYNGYTDTVNILYEQDIPSGNEPMIPITTDNTGIFMRDNDMTYPYIYYIREYADKIADKMIAFDVATNRLKTPFIYTVDDIQLKDTVEKLTRKIEQNDDIIIEVKNTKLNDKDNTGFVEHNVSIDANSIDALKNSILFEFNMFLETMGINTNPSPDKTQVVLTPELNSNNGIIGLEQDVRFTNREKFCELASSLLGVTLSVKKNKNIDIDIMQMQQELMGGEDETGDNEDSKEGFKGKSNKEG